MGHSVSNTQRGGFSFFSILTGLLVAVAATSIFGYLTWLGLDSQNYDIHEVVRGEVTWASISAAASMTIGLLLSFMWGGYTAGRMGVSAGIANGLSVALLTVFILGGAGLYLVTVAGIDEITVAGGIGTLPLDLNFTPMGIAAAVAMVVVTVAGAIWGGVLGGRWHSRLEAQVPAGPSVYTTDSFSDLKPAAPSK